MNSPTMEISAGSFLGIRDCKELAMTHLVRMPTTLLSKRKASLHCWVRRQQIETRLHNEESLIKGELDSIGATKQIRCKTFMIYCV